MGHGPNNTRNHRHARYRPNAPQVIAETIAGEAMIVNLATGHYFQYSEVLLGKLRLRGVGALAKGCRSPRSVSGSS